MLIKNLLVIGPRIDGRGFGTQLVYSLCVGATCNLIVFTAMLLSGAGTDLLYRLRQRPLPDQSHKGWRGVVPGALAAALFGPALGLSLADAITGYTSPSVLNFNSTSTRLTLLFSVLATAVSLFIVLGQERLAQARAQAEAAQRQAAENQLRLLQSQLEPHMLFNTLANLRVLIGVDANRAQAMLDQLIAFLRATLSASRVARHPLRDEFARLADYLALMQVRMGERLQCRFDLPDDLAAAMVPPLLLQPLVENAIKHGLEPNVAGGRIDVTARLEGLRLVLRVRDTGVGLAGSPGDGTRFGLAQVRARLTALYGAGAALELSTVHDELGGTLATVHMPLSKS